LSRVISVTAPPVTRRVFQSTVLILEENTTFGISSQRRDDSGEYHPGPANSVNERLLPSGSRNQAIRLPPGAVQTPRVS
jgi:hypothetical protein